MLLSLLSRVLSWLLSRVERELLVSLEPSGRPESSGLRRLDDSPDRVPRLVEVDVVAPDRAPDDVELCFAVASRGVPPSTPLPSVRLDVSRIASQPAMKLSPVTAVTAAHLRMMRLRCMEAPGAPTALYIFSTVLLPAFATQMLAPSNATASGLDPTA